MTAAVRSPSTVDSAARALLAGLLGQPWGQVGGSAYETGRVVSLAPWLAGHRDRVAFLVATQRPDGGWGGPGGYAIVPTLSATEALLDEPAAAGAADKGLRALFRWLGGDATTGVPDTPAVELIAPALVGAINRRLERVPGGWWGSGRLGLPSNVDGSTRARLDAMLAGGGRLPEKFLHCLEVIGVGGNVSPVGPGTVGASPAATAAWLGNRRNHPARRYLAEVVRRYGGGVPCAVPVTTFERAWVLTSLAGAGIDVPAPAGLVGDLAASVGARGAPAGPGLPPDADTTAVVLSALGLPAVDVLGRYETDTHFCTWPGERGFSTSTNAHVLDALAGVPARHRATIRKLTECLVAHQHADGSWTDRWHASPYYATACCALALARLGADRPVPALRRAVRWVLATQRTDGSWGRWSGTAEETAYALRTLLLFGATEHAIVRGYRYLVAADEQPDHPALWHDKDLYAPHAIIKAAILAAQYAVQKRTRCATFRLSRFEPRC
jgi:halimadienyl-diphosphate synthase